jgi:uncharacterized protein
MNNMGGLYERGLGVAKDGAKAREWFEKSAAAGNAFGMNNVGRAFENGWGGAPDDAKAREWYEKAAAVGNRLARGNLARFLDQGKGGAADFARAAQLLLEAARSGNNEVIEILQGDMQKWTTGTRTELKRELARLGHYKGVMNDAWDSRAHTAVGNTSDRVVDFLWRAVVQFCPHPSAPITPKPSNTGRHKVDCGT